MEVNICRPEVGRYRAIDSRRGPHGWLQVQGSGPALHKYVHTQTYILPHHNTSIGARLYSNPGETHASALPAARHVRINPVCPHWPRWRARGADLHLAADQGPQNGIKLLDTVVRHLGSTKPLTERRCSAAVHTIHAIRVRLACFRYGVDIRNDVGVWASAQRGQQSLC